MAQHDYVIDNQSFPATRSDLNSLFQAIASNNSGTSAPSTTYANQFWYDTTNNKFYIRNEDNDAWIELFVLDQTGDHLEKIGNTITLDGTGNMSLAGDLTVDTDTLFVDASANAVGIGTTSPAISGTPAVTLQTKGTSSATTGLIVSSSLDGASSVNLYSGNASSDNPAIAFQNNLRFGSATDIGVGGFAERLRILSGGGITFNGDTATANALDDYEEGTFTPTYAFSSGGGSFSYSIQVGRYTKIGRFVFVQIRIRGQKSGTGSGALQIHGLPFAAANVTNLFGTGAIAFTNNWNARPMGAYIEATNNEITLTKVSSSSNTHSDLDTTIVDADLGTTSTSYNDLILSINYTA